jgi:hypothetical protein
MINHVGSNLLECYPATNIPRITTEDITLRDIALDMSPPELNKKRVVLGMTIKDQPIQFTDRFGNSLAGLLGQSKSVYRLFEPTEVVERAIERGIKAAARVSFVTGLNGVRQALAAVGPNVPTLKAEEYVELLRDSGTDLMATGYCDGSLASFHEPSMPESFHIAGDLFNARFCMHSPLDGYGKPSAYLSTLREVCTNHQIAYVTVFKTSIQTGKGADSDPIPTLGRFLATFNNEEGFGALRSRLENSYRSWASVEEYNGLMDKFDEYTVDQDRCDRKLHKLTNDTLEDTRAHYRIKRHLAELAGHLHEEYGIVNIDQVPAKKRRQLPTKMTVYDLINYATEVATHYATEYGNRVINQYIGSMIGNPGLYDLEGTRHLNEQAQELFLSASTAPVEADMEPTGQN